jgi:hypothetical protein
MRDESVQAEQESPEVSRRSLLKGCGVTLLATASYTIISVLSSASDANAQCTHGCVAACVSSCTGCTTVNCTSGNVPEPPPPTCVQGFKK